MVNRSVRELGGKLIHKRKIRALLIALFSAVSTSFFSFLPYIVSVMLNAFNLKEKLNNTILYTVIVSVIMLIITFFALEAYSSFSLGEKAWYSARMSKNQLCEKKLLFWFRPSRSFKALRFEAALFLVKAMWTTAFLLPSVSVFVCIVALAYSGGIELPLFITLSSGGAFLLVTGLIFRFIVLQRYFIAPYLIASNPRLGAFQAIRQSKNLTDGHLTEIISFKLSFIPWYISCLLIVPVFIFYPRYKQSCSVLAKTLTL